MKAEEGGSLRSSNVILTGATGMIGGLALRYALADSRVATVTTIGRRRVGTDNPRVTEIEHQDFTDFDPVADHLARQDIALFCLGAYTGAVPDDVFRVITVDYVISFAEALHGVNPNAVFCLLSGEGADQTGKSRVSFARYKGLAEKALMEMGFPRLHLFRPGYIYPVTRREEPNVWYRIFRAVYPTIRRVMPSFGITSDELARAMVRAGLEGTPEHPSPVLKNGDIRALV